MGMFSEIATESTVASFVHFLRAELEVTTDPAVRIALKKAGRFALTQFEWSTPAWAAPYTELFKETVSEVSTLSEPGPTGR